MEDGINNSFITLIPKVSKPSTINKYRPISLVESLYKIVAKLSANRLRLVIREVVGVKQFAFVKGKQLMDCALITNKVIDNLKKGRERFLLKANFEKTYDNMDRGFLQFIMTKMGFREMWRKWMMGCIESARILVLVNEVPTEPFRMERGLRQGCPLSSFLFNMVVKAFS